MLRSACFYRPFCGTQDPVRLSVRPARQCPGPDDNNYLVWKWLPLYLYTLFTKDFFFETGHRQLIELIYKGDLRDKPHGKASLSNTHPLACGTFFHSSLTYFHMYIHSGKAISSQDFFEGLLSVWRWMILHTMLTSLCSSAAELQSGIRCFYLKRACSLWR